MTGNGGTMRSEEFRVDTGQKVVDVTDIARRFAAGAADGLLHVFVPHATCGVAILETGAGSDADLVDLLQLVIPRDDRWRHRHGSPGHGADHVLPAIVAPAITVPVVGGRLTLGTWQSICLVDLNVDNPVRTLRLSLIGS